MRCGVLLAKEKHGVTEYGNSSWGVPPCVRISILGGSKEGWYGAWAANLVRNPGGLTRREEPRASAARAARLSRGHRARRAHGVVSSCQAEVPSRNANGQSAELATLLQSAGSLKLGGSLTLPRAVAGGDGGTTVSPATLSSPRLICSRESEANQDRGERTRILREPCFPDNRLSHSLTEATGMDIGCWMLDKALSTTVSQPEKTLQ